MRIKRDGRIIAWCSECGDPISSSSRSEFCPEPKSCKEQFYAAGNIKRNQVNYCQNPKCRCEMHGWRGARRRYCGEKCRLEHLADRRRERYERAVRLRSEGLSRAEIAAQLKISEYTLDMALYLGRTGT